MPSTAPTVFVVDDDPATRDALGVLFKSVRLQMRAYDSAEAFLASYDAEQPGCLVHDVRMPGIDGLELQEELAARQIDIPIIFLTAYGDVPTAVRAMKQGAVDFMTKPPPGQALLDAVKGAMKHDAESRRRRAKSASARARLASLTGREREVLDLVLTGKHNKAVAAELGLSHKTIEFHRKKIMDKMHANTVVDLVRMVLDAESRWGQP